MQSKRAMRFNGDRSRAAELKMRSRKLEEIGKSCKASRGKTTRFAVQRSLRLNLVRAGTPSGGARAVRRIANAGVASATAPASLSGRILSRVCMWQQATTSGERLKLH